MTKKNKSFEAHLTETNEIIERLEQGELPLDEAMAAYKKGVGLIHDAHQLLSDAEKEFATLLETMDALDDERQQ